MLSISRNRNCIHTSTVDLFCALTFFDCLILWLSYVLLDSLFFFILTVFISFFDPLSVDSVLHILCTRCIFFRQPWVCLRWKINLDVEAFFIDMAWSQIRHRPQFVPFADQIQMGLWVRVLFFVIINGGRKIHDEGESRNLLSKILILVA